MLILEAKEKCPHSGRCKYNVGNTCYGARNDRDTTFSCEYVDSSGRITEFGQQRHPMDKTGKMKVIMEGA